MFLSNEWNIILKKGSPKVKFVLTKVIVDTKYKQFHARLTFELRWYHQKDIWMFLEVVRQLKELKNS